MLLFPSDGHLELLTEFPPCMLKGLDSAEILAAAAGGNEKVVHFLINRDRQLPAGVLLRAAEAGHFHLVQMLVRGYQMQVTIDVICAFAAHA